MGVARVRIGQPLMSVRTHDKHKDSVIEALRRTKFKFPGRQKIYISKKWGFTKWDREFYEEMRANGKLQPDGVNVQYKPEHGPLSEWCRIQAELAGLIEDEVVHQSESGSLAHHTGLNEL